MKHKPEIVISLFLSVLAIVIFLIFTNPILLMQLFSYSTAPVGDGFSTVKGTLGSMTRELDTTLLASTYLGGEGSEKIESIAIDSKTGEVFVVGSTISSDFPTTSGAYDREFNDGKPLESQNNDVFVSKFSSDLSTLLASTYIGGIGNDIPRGIALDEASGAVYIAGSTGDPFGDRTCNNDNFPTTSGAYDTQCDGNGDVFVSKLSSDLSTLLASTYIGSEGGDWATDIAIDNEGSVYITGFASYSPDDPTFSSFPVTHGAYDTEYGGHGNVFVTKLDSNLSKLVASTFFGSCDMPGAIAIDSKSAEVYITGYTLYCIGYAPPKTPDTYDPPSDGRGDVFVSKFSSDLSTLLASTYIGGESGDEGRDIVLADTGHVYVTGITLSPDFPTTNDSYQQELHHYEGESKDKRHRTDLFIAKLDNNLSGLIASTFIGGNSYDEVEAIVVDSKLDDVYITGYTASPDYPVTNEAYYTKFNDEGSELDISNDVFVSKLSDDLSTLLASTYIGDKQTNRASNIVADSDGSIYIAGFTLPPLPETLGGLLYSSEGTYPVTAKAYDTLIDGFGSDGFISRLSSSLSQNTGVQNTATLSDKQG